MIPFKELFRLLAVLAIVMGFVFYCMGLQQVSEVLVKSGITILLVVSALVSIRFPRNSMGTPLEKGLQQEHLRMILKDR